MAHGLCFKSVSSIGSVHSGHSFCFPSSSPEGAAGALNGQGIGATNFGAPMALTRPAPPPASSLSSSWRCPWPLWLPLRCPS